MLTQLSVALGFMAAGFQLWGYGSYVKRVERPNTASWSIWTIGAVLDLTSYYEMTHDWVKNILPAVCALACMGVFVYTLVGRRFKRLSLGDWAFIGLDAGITLWWLWDKNPTEANLLYQASTFASFVPILWGVVRDSEDERPRPWLIWTGAYCLFFASVGQRNPRIEELAYPAVNILCHAAMFLAVGIKRRSLR